MMNTRDPEVLFPGGKNVSITLKEKMEFEKNLLKNVNIFTMVIYIFAFLLGVMGNGLVIFIAGFRMKKTVNTVWFLNLAIADFTFTFFLPLNIMYLALGFHWPFGEAICKLNSTIAVLTLYASVYFLMVISIDRCISVRFPVWTKNHRNPRLASFAALGVWILALVLCSPNIHFSTTWRSYTDERIKCYDDFGDNNKTVKITQLAATIVCFTFAFVIPFTVIVFCYGAIVLRIRVNRLSPSSKPFKVITAVIVAFFACWFPYHVFMLLELVVWDHPHLYSAVTVGMPLTSSLALLNSCLNPILYFFMGHYFKERLRRSILLTFENAFAEEESQSNSTTTRNKSSTEPESQNL